jgi:predicted proteasome-type protease
LKTAWDKRLKEAFGSLPPIQWAALSDHDTDTAGNAAS